MSDLIDTLRDHAKQASEEFGHPVEELLFWEAADHIELNAVNYLVLDNEYQTALARIDSLEAVLKRLGDPEEDFTDSNKCFPTRVKFLEHEANLRKQYANEKLNET